MRPAPPIRGVRFWNPQWPGLRLEVLRLSELRERMPASGRGIPQRPGFHHLLLCTEGTGWHQVDFVSHLLEPGTLLHVQPGQVQTWHLDTTAEGLLLFFDPGFLRSERDGSGPAPLMDALWPTTLSVPEADRPRLLGAFRDLHHEYQLTDGSALSARLLQHLLHALLLRIRQVLAQVPAPEGPTGPSALFRLFLEEVERRFAQTRDVGDYAHRLGYSARTLSRAAQAAQGRSAKAVLDARVALEAKRLLAHTRLSIAAIASQLGFSEPTNFVKFFQRLETLSPAEFRRQMLGQAPAGGGPTP